MVPKPLLSSVTHLRTAVVSSRERCLLFVGLVDRQGRFGCLVVAVAVSRCAAALATYCAARLLF